MYYEINVSFKSQHFFATDKRSITTEHALKRVYGVLKEKFPANEGYDILVTKWDKVGKFVDMEGIVDNESN